MTRYKTFLLVLMICLFGVTPGFAQSPSVEVHRVWVEHNVAREGVKGMVMHASVTVAGCKNVKVRESAYFQYQNGQGLKAKSKAFATPSGYVAVSGFLTPRYDSTDFKDLQLFMPYQELNMAKGNWKLQFNLAFYVETGTANMPVIGKSEPVPFNYSK